MRKKSKAICLFFIICVYLTACSKSTDIKSELPDMSSGQPAISDGNVSSRPLFNAQSSIFNSLEVKNEDIISADFDVYLSETEADFLFVEVEEDVQVTLNYTYTTEDVANVKLGYYLEGETKKISSILDAATDEAYDTIWLEKTIYLKKGVNVFYLSGTNCTCQMLCEIRDLDKSKFTYVGAYPKEKTLP